MSSLNPDAGIQTFAPCNCPACMRPPTIDLDADGQAVAADGPTSGAPRTGLSLDDIIRQLRTSWGGSTPDTYPFVGTGGTSVTYSILTSAPPLDTSPENAGWRQMSATMGARAAEAFELWDDLIYISLNAGSANPSSNAQIIQFAYSSTTQDGGTYEYSAGGYYTVANQYGGSNVAVTRAEIWLNSSWSTHSTTSAINQTGYGYYGAYGFTTYVHEIGHALGLSHPGAYNAGNGNPNYANDAYYREDTRRYSIMSYWDANADNSGTDHFGSDGQQKYAQTPMLHDIAAIQAIYGADTTTRTGNTTYGFNSTAGKDVYDFTRNINPIIAIYDAGGTNTLDLSGFSGTQRIDMRSGTYSDVGGFMTNNLAIAYNTTIHNAVGGSGNDTIIGNASNNIISGGNGSDLLIGGEGADQLSGGANNDTIWFDNLDTLDGGTGIDFATAYYSPARIGITTHLVGIEGVYGSAFDDVVNAAGQNVGGTFYGYDGNDAIYGTGFGDTISGGIGADTLDGGGGNDTIEFDFLDVVTGGSGIDFASAFYSAARIGITTHLAGFEGVYGTGFNDVFNAAGQNVGGSFYGYNGNDAIYGSGFGDFISGGAGSDTIDGGGGNDNIEFDHLDIVTGGSGFDFASAFYSEGGINLNTAAIGIEGVYGTRFNDVINARSQGSDGSFYGYDGHDTIFSTWFADTINGGNGFDYVVYGGQSSAYTWTRSGANWQVRETSTGVTDTLTAVEVLRFDNTQVVL